MNTKKKREKILKKLLGKWIKYRIIPERHEERLFCFGETFIYNMRTMDYRAEIILYVSKLCITHDYQLIRKYISLLHGYDSEYKYEKINVYLEGRRRGDDRSFKYEMLTYNNAQKTPELRLFIMIGEDQEERINFINEKKRRNLSNILTSVFI